MYNALYFKWKAHSESYQLDINVTGPAGALLFDVKPEIALKESLELLF